MRGAVATLLLAAAAVAGPPAEPDGAIAEAARWVEPRGCASGSFRSRALPVVTEVEEAWKIAFDAVLAPPVHWDGTGYVVGRAGGKLHLVAFDLVSGRERARTQLRGFHVPSGLLVWDHMVFLQPDEEQITGYRLSGKTLEVAWILRGKQSKGVWDYPSLPTVHDNEIYCCYGNELARIRPGASRPAWTMPLRDTARLLASTPVRFAARPAILGPYVFAAWHTEETDGAPVCDLGFSVFRRSDGERLLAHRICGVERPPDVPPDLQLTLAASRVFLSSGWHMPTERGPANQVMIPMDIAGGRVRETGTQGFWSCSVPAALHPRLGALLLSPPGGTMTPAAGLQLCLERDGQLYLLTEEAEQADLFRDRVSPTVLGDIVYFGSWAADLETGEILWRLPLADRATHPMVPADGLVLVVDGATLRAFRGRSRR
jgi:hypothetical protein